MHRRERCAVAGAAEDPRAFDALLEDALLEVAAKRAPTHRLVSIAQVGAYAAFPASEEAGNITGGAHYIDGGNHIVG